MPAPPPLRPYLGFARLSPQVLDAIARVVETDDEFRGRVAAEADEAKVGRAGWLWLTRPDGWDHELAAIEAESVAKAADEAEQREERVAVRKLAATQAALDRADGAAAEALAAAESLRAELVAERSARLAAEAQLTEERALAQRLAEERREAIRSLKERDAQLTERGTLLNTARARILELETGVRGGPATPGPMAPSLAPSGTAAPNPPAPPASDPPPPPPASSPLADPTTPSEVPATVVTGVVRAAEAAASLAEALAAVAAALGEPNDDLAAAGTRRASTAVQGPPVGCPDDVRGVSDHLTAAAGARATRTPVALPGGVFDDSVEAAEHLLRTPGAVLVVDGYNVTMHAWRELGKAEQRRRLMAAVSDLAHRTSTRVEVVFDGAEVEPLTVPAALRSLVRVRFSPPKVEADDVIIDLVGHLPAATPVIVASSDNRVRTGVARRGANLLKADQLAAVLRR